MTRQNDDLDSNAASSLTESLPAGITEQQGPSTVSSARLGSKAGRATEKPWQAKGVNPKHEKKIGMAPRGTRRSMGKR